ncbi:MAG: hypothetical protein COB39_03655 [Marinosulfonomonas sp.]|nr:MAG: hypothetical protein COB39_03655 [Marinosulfonomonas sp.]
MKKLTLAAAFAVAASPALSGSLSDPIVEPMITAEVVETGTVSSDGGILVPLMALLFFAAAATN